MFPGAHTEGPWFPARGYGHGLEVTSPSWTLLWAAAGLWEAGSLPFCFHVDLPGLAGEATLSHPKLLLVLAPSSEIFRLCCPTWLAVHSYYFCRLEAPPFPVFLITRFPTSSCERFNSVLWAFMGCLQVGSCIITNLPPCFPHCLKLLICMLHASAQPSLRGLLRLRALSWRGVVLGWLLLFVLLALSQRCVLLSGVYTGLCLAVCWLSF